MEGSRFEQIKGQITAATAGQILVLEDLIARVVSQQFTEMALARRTRRTLQARTCPHCDGNDIVLHGKDQNGRQRFKCRGCCKSYNILTGTPMARARKPEKWARYLECMTGHMSVRAIVASGIGVNHVTVWRWRHRFLEAAANDNTAILSGVVEADVTVFPWSCKGSRDGKAGKPDGDGVAGSHGKQRAPRREAVPLLTAVDNGGHVFDAILSSPGGIEAALAGRIAAGSVLCSDGNAAYVAAADKANAEHYAVFVLPSTFCVIPPQRLGLGRVRNHHQRLRYLINERCRRVATRYLRNYLGWHRAMMRPGFDGKALLSLALA